MKIESEVDCEGSRGEESASTKYEIVRLRNVKSMKDRKMKAGTKTGNWRLHIDDANMHSKRLFGSQYRQIWQRRELESQEHTLFQVTTCDESRQRQL